MDMKKIVLFPLRVTVFLVGWLAYWMEIGADWVIGARGKTEYVRTGSCNRCGRCCRLLALIVPKGVSRHGWLVRAFGLWHRIAMNFQQVSEEEGWLVYRCGYYRAGEGDSPGYCSIYPFRHRLCRFFPRQMLYGHPSLHKDCGYKFVRRDVLARERMIRAEGKPAFREVIDSEMKSS